MTQTDKTRELMGVFVEAARAHHEATGGTSPRWAKWYAERSVDDINRLIEADMSVDELADWLDEADRRYNEENPELSWPRAYATWLLEETG